MIFEKVDTTLWTYLHSYKALLELAPKNDQLRQDIAASSPLTGQYAWIRDPLSSWAWDEAVWNTRLLACFEASASFEQNSICNAFRWTPANYKAHLLSVFSNFKEKELHITPLWGGRISFYLAKKVFPFSCTQQKRKQSLTRGWLPPFSVWRRA